MNTHPIKLPKVTDETKGFWNGCKLHELRMQRCRQCQAYRFPPQIMCPKCHSLSVEWSKVSGRGTIYSFAVPYGPSPGDYPIPDLNYPYAIVLVELDEFSGLRLASNMIGCNIDDIKIGMPVEVVFEDINEEISLPRFKPV